tara:strand:- start:862 stop:1260 length:399 start_codon:yes stop_codon:yes gene_type:complete
MKRVVVNHASLTAAVTGGALLVSAILPHGEVDGMKLCPIFHLTGHECPFCGMSRGFVAITHLDIPRAIEFNPGSPLIYGAFVYMFWGSVQSLREGETALKPVKKKLYYSWLIPTILVFLFMFYQRVIKVFFL